GETSVTPCVQAVMADSCEEAPPPMRVPAAPPSPLLSLPWAVSEGPPPHAERVSAPAARNAAAVPKRLSFTWVPFDQGVGHPGDSPVQGDVPECEPHVTSAG